MAEDVEQGWRRVWYGCGAGVVVCLACDGVADVNDKCIGGGVERGEHCSG